MACRSDRRHSYSDAKNINNSNTDDPPNSRLFIICSKQLTEDDFRKEFSMFGKIEELWVVKDRHTGERKGEIVFVERSFIGVTYIKYSRTSEAARAMEEMNGKIIGNVGRQIKVMIAASRERGSLREENEEEKIQRLFVIVPKTMTQAELMEYFKTFGDIDYVSIIKDKETSESKGFAYVKYFKFSHAALAYEECDRNFKPVFAEPRNSKKNDDYGDNKFNRNMEILPPRPFNNVNNLPLPNVVNHEGFTKLLVVCPPMLNQDQLWRLFDIVPGLDYCHLRIEGRARSMRGIGTVVYNNPQWAAYALEKLHGFEYPPGYRLIVKPDMENARSYGSSTSSLNQVNNPDIRQLAETIAQATNIIKAAGLSPDLLQNPFNNSNVAIQETICSVPLPEKQPLANVDEDTAARCFIVCSPTPPPPVVLKDVFCRFGGLIEVYMLSHRNCGYAKYSTKEAAANAIKTLHGAEVNGIRLKVIRAEERDGRKRMKLDDGQT